MDTIDNTLLIVDIIWLCYDYGVYTHQIAVELITNIAIHDMQPIADSAELEVQCHNIYVELEELK